MKKIMSIALSALLAGCAATNQVNPETMQTATAPLVCSNARQCARWWARAQDWVSRHSAYPIQKSTESLIETAGPEGGDARLAYQITKTSDRDGSETIGFAAHCDSMLGCRPDPWRAGAAFKAFVRTGAETPAPPSPGAALPK